METGTLVIWKIDHAESIEKKLNCNPDLEIGIVLDKRNKLTNKIKVPSVLVFWTGRKVSSGWSPLESIKKI